MRRNVRRINRESNRGASDSNPDGTNSSNALSLSVSAHGALPPIHSSSSASLRRTSMSKSMSSMMKNIKNKTNLAIKEVSPRSSPSKNQQHSSFMIAHSLPLPSAFIKEIETCEAI